VLARTGRFGPYVQLGQAEDGGDRPRTASLLPSMSLQTLGLDEALRLLELPRVLGTDEATGEEIVAMNGRFGPYLKRGDDTRSLEDEGQLFQVTLAEAIERFTQPKQRRFAAAAAPLRELGADPVSGQPVVLRSGRFGPYVTDGTLNASLRREDDPDTITIERAAALLQARREAGPSKRGRAGKPAPGGKKGTGARRAAPKRSAGTKKAPGKKAAAAKRAGRPAAGDSQ
jgi:DNA topoisomerase-1